MFSIQGILCPRINQLEIQIYEATKFNYHHPLSLIAPWVTLDED